MIFKFVTVEMISKASTSSALPNISANRTAVSSVDNPVSPSNTFNEANLYPKLMTSTRSIKSDSMSIESALSETNNIAMSNNASSVTAKERISSNVSFNTRSMSVSSNTVEIKTLISSILFGATSSKKSRRLDTSAVASASVLRSETSRSASKIATNVSISVFKSKTKTSPSKTIASMSVFKSPSSKNSSKTSLVRLPKTSASMTSMRLNSLKRVINVSKSASSNCPKTFKTFKTASTCV